MWILLLAMHVPMCFTSDIRATCCPAACAQRMPSTANTVLRACIAAIGCRDDSATVGMRCECRKGYQ